jgi:transposase InsO family protein
MVNQFDYYDLKGKHLIFGGRKAIVLSVDDTDNLIFIRFEDKQVSTLEFKDFLDQISSGNIHIMKPLLESVNAYTISLTQQRTINRREAYTLEMAKHKNPHTPELRKSIILKVAGKIGDPNPPGGSTVSKWFKRWERDSFDIKKQVLLKNTHRKTRLDEQVEIVITKIINKYFLKREGLLKSQCYMKLKLLMIRLGMGDFIPSARSFERRIDKLDPMEVVTKRKGSSEAKKAFRKIKHKFNITLPLERVELDTGNFNLGIIEIQDGVKYFIGSVSLHLCFCAGTASLLGYSSSIGNTGEQSGFVVNALYHAISRKTDKRYIQSGVPTLIVMDAGAGYLSDTTRSFLDSINCTYDVTPTRQPWAKGFVERFIRHIRDTVFRGMKGYLGKYNPLEYTDTNLKKAAKVTIEQFRQKFANFVHEYHNTPLDRLKGLTPNQAWEKGISQYPPMHIEDMAELKKFKGERVKGRVLNPNLGVYHRGYWFNSDELQSLYFILKEKQKKGKVEVDLLVDPLDAGALSVIVPPKVSLKVGRLEFVEATNTANHVDGKSFAQLEAKSKGTKVLDGASCFVTEQNEWTKYQSKPRTNGDLIDIQLPDTPEDFDPETELEDILASCEKEEHVASELGGDFMTDDEPQSHSEDEWRIL